MKRRVREGVVFAGVGVVRAEWHGHAWRTGCDVRLRGETMYIIRPFRVCWRPKCLNMDQCQGTNWRHPPYRALLPILFTQPPVIPVLISLPSPVPQFIQYSFHSYAKTYVHIIYLVSARRSSSIFDGHQSHLPVIRPKTPMMQW